MVAICRSISVNISLVVPEQLDRLFSVAKIR